MSKSTPEAKAPAKDVAWLEVHGLSEGAVSLNMGKTPTENGSLAFGGKAGNDRLMLFVNPKNHGIYVKVGEGEQERSIRLFLNEAGVSKEGGKKYPAFLSGNDGVNGPSVTANIRGKAETVAELLEDLRAQDALGRQRDAERKANKDQQPAAATPAAKPRTRRPS